MQKPHKVNSKISKDLPKRKCHGYPGHPCDKEITDYRCPECWAAYRKSLGLCNLVGSADGDSIYETSSSIRHRRSD